MKLSIVTTMYYSAPYLQEFYQRITAAAEKITHDYEIIFVDDGSPDESLSIAVDMHNNDARVKVIELSRNFGHHKAIMCGLDSASGEYVFLIDCDLEEAPELLLGFWDKLCSATLDVVYGVQLKRQDGVLAKFLSNIYYAFVNHLSSVKIIRNLTTARLMTGRYVKALLLYNERELNISHIWKDVGYKQGEFLIKKGNKGLTTYNLSRKLKVLVNSIVSFSSKPLYYMFFMGATMLALSFIYIIYLLFHHFISSAPVSGWTSLMISVWFIGGLVIFSLGVIGIYLSKIFIEVKQRPRVIVKGVYDEKR